MTCGRTTIVAVPVVAVLILGSTISSSLTTDKSRNGGIVSNSQYWDYQKNDRAEGRDKTEPPAMQAKWQFKRGIGDELDMFKDKAKKVNSAYKWLKKNWQKLFVIVVAVIALIAVVGIYRRCFSDSGSSGDDEEPSVVVIRMVKQDDKENNELKEPKVMEGGTHQSGGSRKTTILHGVNNAIHRSDTETTDVKKLPADRRVHRDRSSALVPSNVKGKMVKRKVTRVKSRGFPKRPNFQLPSNGIPISGYCIFQQIECYNLYFHFTQCIFNAKTIANQVKAQPTEVCAGSTNEGPFPVYWEVLLITNLMASLTLKYCEDYIPTASTNTNLPLTVSP